MKLDNEMPVPDIGTKYREIITGKIGNLLPIQRMHVEKGVLRRYEEDHRY